MNTRSSSPSMLGTAQSLRGMAAVVDPTNNAESCISSMINHSVAHNEGLQRLIQRAQTIADRMFGAQPESKTDDKELQGPLSALGALEYRIMIGDRLTCQLMEQIQRLEIL
jgi:hypothetical protein